MKITKKLAMTLAAATILSSPAMANDMLGNQSMGLVNGNITQFSTNESDDISLDAGSLVADYAWGNDSLGYIDGQVYQGTGFMGVDSTLTIDVGSIEAHTAENNSATGLVSGSISQTTGFAADRALLEARVGSIEAENGFAGYNDAIGVVNGHIVQQASGTAEVRARVGSMSSE